MFYFRLNRLKIFNNKEGFLFFDKPAQVKLVSFVATEDSKLPELDDYLNSNNENQKKAILAQAVRSVVSSRIFTEIRNVKDSHEMTFGEFGYILHRSGTVPNFFDWLFVAYESDKNIRSAGEVAAEILADSEFDEFAKNFGSLVSAVAFPQYNAIVAIAKFVAKTISKLAQRDTDDMIGILYTSLVKQTDYPHGERKKDGVADLTNNMMFDYSIFAFQDGV